MLFFKNHVALLAAFLATANALDGIVVPATIQAGSSFKATFKNGNSDKYRVYLAASLTGSNGPTCYLINSTSLSSPVELTIPPVAGPSADYYTIAVADLTSSQGPTYSNAFNLTHGNGTYTDYEKHLGGAPFWDADALPCGSYDCARVCAQASYPNDLTDANAYETMQNCILECPGVAFTNQTTPVHASDSGNSLVHATVTAEQATITLSNGHVVTAIEITVTSDGKTATEAIIGSSQTLTLGGAATISGETLSLVSNGVGIGSSTTVLFSPEVTTKVTLAPSSSGASTAAKSSGGAVKHELGIAGLAGFAGLAALVV